MSTYPIPLIDRFQLSLKDAEDSEEILLIQNLADNYKTHRPKPMLMVRNTLMKFLEIDTKVLMIIKL